jgi:hypothetical protein
VLVRVLGRRGVATGVAVSFGYDRRRRSTVILTKTGGVRGRRQSGTEMIGEKRGGAGSLTRSESTGDARRLAEVRRGIPRSWRRLVQEDEREMEEECWGLL